MIFALVIVQLVRPQTTLGSLHSILGESDFAYARRRWGTDDSRVITRKIEDIPGILSIFISCENVGEVCTRSSDAIGVRLVERV